MNSISMMMKKSAFCENYQTVWKDVNETKEGEMVFKENISHPFPFIHQNISLLRDWEKDSRKMNSKTEHSHVVHILFIFPIL